VVDIAIAFAVMAVPWAAADLFWTRAGALGQSSDVWVRLTTNYELVRTRGI